MSRRKKHHKKRRLDTGPQHILPEGFWSQVAAIVLLATSVLFVVAWFNAGGPIIEWMHNSLQMLIGNAVYVIPPLFIYTAIEIFRAEDNKLPLIMKFAIFFEIIWFSTIFGLFKGDGDVLHGGLVGDLINQGVSMLVDTNVALFIYILLIITTLLFIIRVTPMAIFSWIKGLFSRDISEDEENENVIRGANSVDGGFSVSGMDDDSEYDQESKSGFSRIRGKKSHSFSGSSDDGTRKSQTALMTVSDPDWEAPSLELLENKQSPPNPGDVKQNAIIIRETLKEFDIDVEMEKANVGPRVTQYTLRPPSGVKLSRITALETNLALNLAAQSLRMEAPIPGKSVVGIEVPNVKPADVRIRSILSSEKWQNDREPLAFAIGKDISGEPIIGELDKMPHLLIAGTTGAGKSVMINTLIISLLYRNSPSELKLILVDPKHGVEMSHYDDIPHLLTPVIIEPEKMISALKWSVNEMERRYALIKEHRVRDIKSYNQKIREDGLRVKVEDEQGVVQEHENGAMPYIVIVVDELADFMMAAGRDIESLIARLAQKARAVGIHLVLATQSPRADIITGLIKANISSRIAFTVPSQLESRIILDQGGAEKLLGLGDMLYVNASMPKPKRVQGAWVTNEEIDKIVAHLHMQSPPDYNDDVISQKVHLNGKGGLVSDYEGGDGGQSDPLFDEAVQMVVNTQKASASSLQRRFKLGYNRAARLIDYMEEQGIVGPADGQRPREVLIDSIDEINGPDDVDESDDL